jgi:hypothetical protein
MTQGEPVVDDQWRSLLAEAAGTLDLPPGPLSVEGTPGGLPSRLPVADTAVACVATALTAAGALHYQRGGSQPHVRLNAAHVTAAVRGEAYLRVNGQGFGRGFASLSRFWRAADGWVRTHGNYGTHIFALSLTATAAWLLSQARPPPTGAAAETEPPASEYLCILESGAGPVTVVAPPGVLDGRTLAWPARLSAYGQDTPTWGPA